MWTFVWFDEICYSNVEILSSLTKVHTELVSQVSEATLILLQLFNSVFCIACGWGLCALHGYMNIWYVYEVCTSHALSEFSNIVAMRRLMNLHIYLSSDIM